MNNNKNNLLLVVGVALIVAVVASLGTVALTGNFIKLNPDRNGANKVYTTFEVYKKAEVDAKLNQKTTNQDVLNMLKAYDQGNCKLMEVPTGSLLNPSDDDYESFGKPFLEADLNDDGVTTGVEWADAFNEECLYGFRMRYLSVPNSDFGGHFVNIGPVGCAGGESHEDLMKYQAQHEVYLFCRP